MAGHTVGMPIRVLNLVKLIFEFSTRRYNNVKILRPTCRGANEPRRHVRVRELPELPRVAVHRLVAGVADADWIDFKSVTTHGHRWGGAR